MWLFGRRTVLFWGPKNILKEITLFLKNDAQMDPNWVPKPNKINKNWNEICGKVQRIVSNTNAYNRISVVWGGGDDTPHGVFDINMTRTRADPIGQHESIKLILETHERHGLTDMLLTSACMVSCGKMLCQLIYLLLPELRWLHTSSEEMNIQMYWYVTCCIHITYQI